MCHGVAYKCRHTYTAGPTVLQCRAHVKIHTPTADNQYPYTSTKPVHEREQSTQTLFYS
jgi:hypothetical protein